MAPAPSPHRPAVLLVGHGSARSAVSAEPLLALADALRVQGFEEVRTAFWKEETFLHQALDTVRGTKVVVLPVFLAEGYFTGAVVPRELGLAYGPNRLDGRDVHLLRPVGAAPALAALVLDRALDAAGAHAELGMDTLLVVLGHGTTSDPSSERAVRAVCARLAEYPEVKSVVPAFIDQPPRVADVVTGARASVVVVVPFLMAEGWHGGVTVPQDLARASAGAGLDEPGRPPRVIYAEPVGTHPGIATIAEVLLREGAGGAAPPAGDPGRTSTPLAQAERTLVEHLSRRGAIRLLQVHVAGTDDGWELRHAADADADREELVAVADAPALERRTRLDSAGAHRPLRTAADLPRGWRLRARSAPALGDALVALYGPALTHWHRATIGALAPASFRAAAARQTGMYARLGQIGRAAVEAGIARVCDGRPCLRRRLWDVEEGPMPDAGRDDIAGGGDLIVPCPAPCSILLTTVLELAGDPDVEREPD